MSASAETVRVALLALMAGAALPLVVQLFVTMRGLRRTTAALERRLDHTLRDIDGLATDVRRGLAAPASSLPAVLAAAVPALLAAVKAFRASMHDEAENAPSRAEGRANGHRPHGDKVGDHGPINHSKEKRS